MQCEVTQLGSSLITLNLGKLADNRTTGNTSATDTPTEAKSPRNSIGPHVVQILKELHRDESSGLDPAVASKSLGYVRNFALGEKIARGMVVTFGERTPHIHILDTEIKPIMRSLGEYGNKLAECVEKYERVEGETPSKNGCRVFSMVLRKLVSSPEAIRGLKSICDEALNVDLISPQDKDWRREIVVPLSGVNTRISLSLVPLSVITRKIMGMISTDVPAHERGNRFGYRLVLEPETPRSGAFVKLAYGLLRQGISFSSLSSPMIVATYLMTRFQFGALVPHVSENGMIQGAFAEAAVFSVLAAVGVLTYQGHRALTSRWLLADDPPQVGER